MFKIAFWLALIGGAVFVGGQVLPVYYTHMKIENVFEGVAQMPDLNEDAAKGRIKKVFRLQSVDVESLPQSFFENLSIKKENGKLKIGSEYHITLWLLGKPQSVDPDSDYRESEVEPMDKLRLKTRLDFDFEPYKETP